MLLDSATKLFDPAKVEAVASQAFATIIADVPGVFLYDIVFIHSEPAVRDGADLSGRMGQPSRLDRAGRQAHRSRRIGLRRRSPESGRVDGDSSSPAWSSLIVVFLVTTISFCDQGSRRAIRSYEDSRVSPAVRAQWRILATTGRSEQYALRDERRARPARLFAGGHRSVAEVVVKPCRARCCFRAALR